LYKLKALSVLIEEAAVNSSIHFLGAEKGWTNHSAHPTTLFVFSGSISMNGNTTTKIATTTLVYLILFLLQMQKVSHNCFPSAFSVAVRITSSYSSVGCILFNSRVKIGNIRNRVRNYVTSGQR